MFNLAGLGSISRLLGFVYIIIFYSVPKNFSLSAQLWQTRFWMRFIFLLTTVSILHMNQTSAAVIDWPILMNVILFIVLLTHSKQDEGILEYALLCFAIGSIMLTILFTQGIGVVNDNGRVTIFNDNQNQVGNRLAISIIFLIYLFLKSRYKLMGLMYLFPVPIMLNFMLSTGSRSALGSTIIALVLLLIFNWPKTFIKKVFVISLSSKVFFWLVSSITASEIVMKRMNRTIEGGGMHDRVFVWKNMINIIKSSPVYGLGVSGSREATIQTFGVFTSPHNVVLEILLLTGVIGLIMYSYFLFKVYGHALTVLKRQHVYLPIVLLVPVTTMILTGHVIGRKEMWLILAYVFSFQYVVLNRRVDYQERIR